jgi:hypothetical protein
MKRALSWGAWSAWVVIGLLSTAGLASPQSSRACRKRNMTPGRLASRRCSLVAEAFPA